jgi:hypothetical protein
MALALVVRERLLLLLRVLPPAPRRLLGGHLGHERAVQPHGWSGASGVPTTHAADTPVLLLLLPPTTRSDGEVVLRESCCNGGVVSGGFRPKEAHSTPCRGGSRGWGRTRGWRRRR